MNGKTSKLLRLVHAVGAGNGSVEQKRDVYRVYKSAPRTLRGEIKRKIIANMAVLAARRAS